MIKAKLIHCLFNLLKLDDIERESIAQAHDNYIELDKTERPMVKHFGDTTYKGAVAASFIRISVDNPFIFILFVLAVVTTPFRVLFHFI